MRECLVVFKKNNNIRVNTASPMTSMVMCADHPGLTFNLSLVRSEPTYNQPMQQWTFISDFAVSLPGVYRSSFKNQICSWYYMIAFVIIGSLYCLSWFRNCWNTFLQVRDYSGTYTVKLVPCTAPPGVEYSFRPVCHPREPITFDLDIRFQQVITECKHLSKGSQQRLYSWVCMCIVCCEYGCVIKMSPRSDFEETSVAVAIAVLVPPSQYCTMWHTFTANANSNNDDDFYL